MNPDDPRAHAQAELETQLGRAGRITARRAMRRFPDEIRETERILCIALGEVPPSGKQHAELAVLAATNRRFLVVSRLRADSHDYRTITSVDTEKKRTGGLLHNPPRRGGRFRVQGSHPEP